MSHPRPLEELPRPVAHAIEGLLFDIDDTITTDGKLTAEAYESLWRASEAGLLCVAISGRPAGWCDHFARMWPVAAVVGENGGLCFWMKNGRMRRRYWFDAAARQEHRRRLEQIRDEVLERFPKVAVSADQPYRELDLAIDFCEDVPASSLEDAREIKAIFESHGATAKVSSIHVNGWYGAYDKLSMLRVYLGNEHGVDVDEARERFVFVGDSPNDEPMFRHFPNAVGVANLGRFVKDMDHPPAFIAKHPSGAGFSEVVSTLLDGRRSG